MSTITVNDLNANCALSSEELATVNGGWYWLYQPAYSYYYNPFVSTLQSSWASRGTSFDTQHNNFISFLRS
ncbi:MAG: hypothetical protein CME44_02040 [Haliea sp.]|jgi:hypothetical protein|nr:hypothetical protein [Haliea sp.]